MQSATHPLPYSDDEERSAVHALRATHGSLLALFGRARLAPHDQSRVFEHHLCDRVTTVVDQLRHSISGYKWTVYCLRNDTPEILPLHAAADRASQARIALAQVFVSSGTPTAAGRSFSELLEQHLLDLGHSIHLMEKHLTDSFQT